VAQTCEDQESLRLVSDGSSGFNFFRQKFVPSTVYLGCLLISGCNGRGDATSNREVSHDNHLVRGTRGDQVIENLIRDLFIKDATVAEAYEIVLQSFELQAASIRDVIDFDFTEIWQSSLWA
jgi:hypothetical protein